ncbi:hypothetical protein PHYBOEH_005544 [Phytophthora boehmeriae]|uniref:Uncharacterized protein n=1 Tax=Phytophthora boehmeriae TaxID=109152 RepID=A0A8T1WLL9_9STRA|nr:hypothetical protein PHYBOEH_005544 [Phytophthora boehmeriae]
MVTDAPELLNGTYEAFKARKHQEFDQQHGGKPHHAQQKLLRVHLRHFLLTMRSQLDGDELQTGICTDSDKKQSDRAFLSEQKRLAIAREMLRAERQRAARVLQSFLRRRLATKILHEKELPSTSEFVAVPRERKAAVLPDARPIAAKIEDVARTSSLSRAALPPYEVVAQVIAARDLALTSPVSGHSGDRFVEAELVLKGKTGEMARVVSPKQFLETLQDGDIQWQGFTLRFAIDPGDSARISPESVVDDWSASIELNITGTSGIEATLGVVEIPLSLLNTPLASQKLAAKAKFATRWFHS